MWPEPEDLEDFPSGKVYAGDIVKVKGKYWLFNGHDWVDFETSQPWITPLKMDGSTLYCD